MGLLLEDMDQLWIPRFSTALEKAIVTLVRAAQAEYETAKAKLADAENNLMSALGVGNWQPPT